MELQLVPQPEMNMWLTSCLIQVLRVRNQMMTRERGFLSRSGSTILTLKSTGTLHLQHRVRAGRRAVKFLEPVYCMVQMSKITTTTMIMLLCEALMSHLMHSQPVVLLSPMSPIMSPMALCPMSLCVYYN